MKFVRMLSVPLLVMGFVGSVSAFQNGSFLLSEGPYPRIGGDVWRFVDAPQGPSTTRAEVLAELREAQRLGLVNAGGEGDIPVATLEQQRLIAEAGLRARNNNTAIARR